MQSTRQANGTTTELLDRAPPSDIEAEKMTLGSVLTSATPCETFGKINETLQPRDFYDGANRIVFESMIRLRRESKPIDIKLLCDSLKSATANDVRAFDEIGGAAYLLSLAKLVPNATHAVYYASIVREKADKRRLFDFALQTAQASHNGKPAADIVTAIRETLAEIEQRDNSTAGPSIVTFGKLAADYPALRHPVIDGILRRGETMNVIADPKRGKSWMLYGMLLSVATSLPWLGRFHCEPGRVLLIDNELHPETLAHRIPKVATAMDIDESDYCRNLDILTLRGRLLDLVAINRILATVERGKYSLVAFDAWYRGIPVGVSENDNASVASLYNLIDQITAHLNAAWVNIHHASKGAQAGKAVTDVGAGAGSQSRAADTHLVLREHQEPGVTVLDGVVRSFAPLQAVGLTWEFPLWRVNLAVDPKQLAGLLTRGDERQNQKDEAGIDAIKKALAAEPATANMLRAATGLSRDRCAKLLAQLEKAGTLASVTTIKRNNECKLYRLNDGDKIPPSIATDGGTDGGTGEAVSVGASVP